MFNCTNLTLNRVRFAGIQMLFTNFRGRAVTNVGKTCGPTPCFILAINMFKLKVYQYFKELTF